MARLTADEWDEIRAAYEVHGDSFGVLAERWSVSKSSISRKAKKQGWVQGKMQHLVEKKANAIKELKSIRNETQHLKQHHATAFEQAVEFRLRNESRMEKAALKAEQMIHEVEKPSDVKAIMDTFARHREAVLGKNPEVAIQVNNQVQVINPFAEDAD